MSTAESIATENIGLANNESVPTQGYQLMFMDLVNIGKHFITFLKDS